MRRTGSSPPTRQKPQSNQLESLPFAAPCSFHELGARTDGNSGWLWEGILMSGCLTLLTSQWKSGKTTLLSILLAKLHSGGSLLGQRVRSGRAMVISEENELLWRERGRKLDFGPKSRWLCRPFPGKPTPEAWSALIDYLVAEHAKEPFDLVAIDSLAVFLPTRSENESTCMLEALLPLQRLTAAGMSILGLHHPKKGEVQAGQAARGAGALPGSVDILLEMYWHSRPFEDDRRRRLLGFSRFDETPRRLLFELNAERTDYLVHGDYLDEEFARDLQALYRVLGDDQHKLTRHEILDDWPEECERPDENTLWRWLDRAVKQGLILHEGLGRRNSPFRYWLPGEGR